MGARRRAHVAVASPVLVGGCRHPTGLGGPTFTPEFSFW